MKIAIVTPTYPPYRGGIGNVAAAQHRFFLQAGHESTVITPRYSKKNNTIDSTDSTESGIQRIAPTLEYGNAALLAGLHKQLSGYDIVLLHYPFFGAAEVLWLHQRYLKKRGVKFMVYYHMDVIGQPPLKTAIEIHRKILLPKIIKMANRVIITSTDYAEHSFIQKQFQKNPEKFIEIPNGVDTSKFNLEISGDSVRKRHEISEEEKIILFVGGLDRAHYFKGVEYLIEAVSRLQEVSYVWRLIIVGRGDMQQRYRDLSGQLHLDNKVLFVDDVDNTALPAYYAAADVTVLPSIDKSEAFGMVLIESFACATPVIASDIPGVRSVIDDGKNGMVTKVKDADDIATKIHYILTNSNIAQQFAQAGFEKAIAVYDWEKVIEKTLAECKKINGSRKK